MMHRTAGCQTWLQPAPYTSASELPDVVNGTGPSNLDRKRDIGSVGSGRWDKIIFRVIRRGYRTEDKLFCPECLANAMVPCGLAQMPDEYALWAMVEVARSRP